MDNGGLNLDKPDEIEADEWTGHARAQFSGLGFPDGLPMWQLWKDYRPDLIKSHRMNMRHAGPQITGQTRLPFVPADLHLYLLTQFTMGVEYELIACQNFGYSRAEVMDIIAVAALDTVSQGMNDACTPKTVDLIRGWTDPDVPGDHFPSNWKIDPDVMTSGIDLGEPGLTDAEASDLRAWYLRIAGEIPPWLELLDRDSRGYAKTQRIRWERALKVSPPAMLPFLQLHYNSSRANLEGIREQTLLGRGLGMTKDEVVATIIHGAMVMGGLGSLSTAERAVGDILRNW